MPGYIGLLKYTQQGLADIKNGGGGSEERKIHDAGAIRRGVRTGRGSAAVV